MPEINLGKERTKDIIFTVVNDYLHEMCSPKSLFDYNNYLEEIYFSNQKNQAGQFTQQLQIVTLSKLFNKLNPSRSYHRSRGYVAYSDNVHKRKERFKLTTNRFLTRKLCLDTRLPDKKIKHLAFQIDKALYSISSLFQIKIIKGEEITDTYAKGFGNTSCMTGDRADYTLLYEHNSEKIEMIIAYRANLEGRAILWILDDGQKYADRIYCNSSEVFEAMIYFIKKQGWLSFEEPSCKEKELKVSGLVFEDGHVPYMDSFCYGDIVKGKLNLSNHNGELSLQSTDGCLDGSTSCEICGEYFSENDMSYHYGCYYCYCCFEDNFSMCNHCDCFVNNDKLVEVRDLDEHWCPACRRKFAHSCDYCGSYFSKLCNNSFCEDCNKKHGDEREKIIENVIKWSLVE